MIDTLKFATRLRSAGFSQEQAEAVAGAWAEQAADELPSKLDFVRLDGRIHALDDRIAALDDRINALDDKLESRINALDDKLESRIAALAIEVGRRVTGLESKLSDRITRLEGRLDKQTWMIGFLLAGTLAILVRLLLIGP